MSEPRDELPVAAEDGSERGSLADVSFPELLKRLHDARLSGTLAVRRDPVLKSVYFQDGRVIFARSTDANDRLGEFLLRKGVISLRQYLESATRILPGRRQGAVLVDMMALAPEDLVRYVTEQVTEILYTLFGWNTGSWEVRADAHDTQERIVLNIPVEDVLLQGLRRVSDWHRMWRGLGASIDTVFRETAAAKSLAYRATLSDDEAHTLERVDGRLSVGRILEVSFVSNFETCRALWALRVAGAIEPLAADDPGPAETEDYALAEVVEDHDRVLTFIYGFITERIGDLVDHLMDRALKGVEREHPETLAGVHLRNQGRVEYEQLSTNLGSLPAEERRRRVVAALGALIGALIALTGKELGPDERAVLEGELGDLAAELPRVPLPDIVDRAAVADPLL